MTDCEQGRGKKVKAIKLNIVCISAYFLGWYIKGLSRLKSPLHAELTALIVIAVFLVESGSLTTNRKHTVVSTI